jgi:hypothetical protein
MLRMISVVPPSIELARARRNAWRMPWSMPSTDRLLGAAERVVVADHAVGAEQVDAELGDTLVELGHRELGDRPSGPGLPAFAAAAAARALVRRRPRRACSTAHQLVRLAPVCWSGGSASRGRARRRPGPRRAPPLPPPIAVRSFISVVSETRQPSPTGRRASRRDADVGEVDLVELGLAGDLAQRPHLDAGRVHVDHEGGHALVLHGLGVGAGDEHAPARQVGERGPHLLAVDDPLVAVAHALRGEAGEVAAGPGSLNSWHHFSSPVNIGRRKRCFCSSLPWVTIVGPAACR